MSSDPDTDVDGLLRKLRVEGKGPRVRSEQLWALAAGELAPEQASGVARAATRNPASMEELGIAAHLLDDSDREQHVQALDIPHTLDLIRSKNLAAARRRRFRLAAGLGASFAAAAVALVLLWPERPAQWAWSANAALASTRGGPADTLEFHVTLRPDRRCFSLLFAVYVDSADKVQVERLHPPVPAVLSTAQYAEWPRDPLPTDSETVLPKDSLGDPFSITAKSGFLVLLSQKTVFEEAAISRIREVLLGALSSPLSESTLAAGLDHIRSLGPVQTLHQRLHPR